MKGFLKDKPYDKYYQELLPYFKEEKNQRYFMLILTFGASIFFLLFAISPTISTIAKLNKQIADSKFVDQKLSEKINSLSTLSQSYNNLSQDLQFVTNAVPIKPEAPTLAALIQGVADESSTQLTALHVSSIEFSGQAASNSSNFSFSISGNGSYESINNFVSSLSSMQRVITINSLQFTKGAQEGNVGVEIGGSAFYKP